jgi:hypothetical protein
VGQVLWASSSFTLSASTRLTGSALLVSPDGVATVGTWGLSEICDDPAEQPEARRRQGGTEAFSTCG